MRILGVDPGLANTGYGVIEVAAGRMTPLQSGVIVTQPKGWPLEKRLKVIYDGIIKVLLSYWPHAMALEEVYSHYQQPRTAILLGHARSVICLAAAQHNVSVYSYPATQVKEALTGDGRASKYRVQRAVQLYLDVPHLPRPSHIADALALAIAHSYVVGAR